MHINEHSILAETDKCISFHSFISLHNLNLSIFVQHFENFEIFDIFLYAQILIKKSTKSPKSKLYNSANKYMRDISKGVYSFKALKDNPKWYAPISMSYTKT